MRCGKALDMTHDHGSNVSGVAPQCKSARKPAKNADVQMQRFVDCAKLLLVAACGGIEIFRDAKKRIAPHRTQRAVAFHPQERRQILPAISGIGVGAKQIGLAIPEPPMKSLNVELFQVAPHHGNDAASILHHIAQESTSKPLCTLCGVDSGSDAYELRNVVRADEPEGEPRVCSQALDIGWSTFSDHQEKADADTDPGESPQKARHASRPVGTPALRFRHRRGCFRRSRITRACKRRQHKYSRHWKLFAAQS